MKKSLMGYEKVMDEWQSPTKAAATNKCHKPLVDNDLKQARQGANDLKNG